MRSLLAQCLLQTRLSSSDGAIQSFALLHLVLSASNPAKSLLPYFSVRPRLACRLLYLFSLSENIALKTPLFYQSILCLSRWLNLCLSCLTCKGTQHLQPRTRYPQLPAAERGSVTLRLGAVVADTDALGLWLRNTSHSPFFPAVSHSLLITMLWEKAGR